MIPAAQPPGKLSLAAVNALSLSDFMDHFHGVFEHSPWIVEAIAPLRPFATRGALLAAMARVVAEAKEDAQHALLAAHPVLGGAAARDGRLTAESRSEQASHGLNRMEEEEAQAFMALNAAYQERFGFPFIIAVRGQRDRTAILAALRRRLTAEPAAERQVALAEVVKIAGFRLAALVEARPLSLSLHVLDTARGTPGIGLGFTVHAVMNGSPGPAQVAAETDAGGRWACDPARPLPPGLYEVCFRAGAYQNRFAPERAPDEEFYEDITIRFRMREEGGHYHIPLILSPFGYSTYRGG